MKMADDINRLGLSGAGPTTRMHKRGPSDYVILWDFCD